MNIVDALRDYSDGPSTWELCERAANEIEALRRDAARYRWLRENCLRAVTVSADSVAITDAAIDAAMKT